MDTIPLHNIWISIAVNDLIYGEGLFPELIEPLVFHIGLIELISYWKLACPPKVIIKPGRLTDHQVSWWRSLYFNGLGEFFYTNGISASQDEFIHEFITEGKTHQMIFPDSNSSILVPVGGGKDSVVTLELLKNQKKRLVPFVLNPREASWRSIEKAGFVRSQTLAVNRKLDPLMLELNNKGFLNGHTPFSALLAFVSVLGATLTGSDEVALSNESSANEPTIPGTMINHQYSKSFHFESVFREYLKAYLAPGINYYSFLRPVNEIQIARFFSDFPAHFFAFRSCNVGSKTDSWCGQCSKCLFTYIVLSPFLQSNLLREIFGRDLLNDSSLSHILEDLAGMSDEKPFECVGTIQEVKATLDELINQYEPGVRLPALLNYYRAHRDNEPGTFRKLLRQWSEENFVPAVLAKHLKNSIDA